MDRTGNCLGVTGVAIDATRVLQIEKFKSERNIALKLAEHRRLLAASIAHDLRTPLASINMGTQGLEPFLQTLLQTYDLACQQGLVEDTISARKKLLLEQLSTRIQRDITAANQYIDIMLDNLKQTLRAMEGPNGPMASSPR